MKLGEFIFGLMLVLIAATFGFMYGVRHGIDYCVEEVYKEFMPRTPM